MTTPTTIAMAIVYGVSQALIGLNVQHDANHGAASKKPWVNNIYGLGADFIGGCNDGPKGGIVKLSESGQLDGMLKGVGAL